MPVEVRMPKLSDNMEEGVIIRWMKAPGDAVARGEPLAEVETDKADVEIEAPEAGVVREIRVPQGQSAAVGAIIAVLAAPDERVTAAKSVEGADEGAEANTVGAAAEPAPVAPHKPPEAHTAPAAAPPLRASPLAWRLAEEAGVDLAGLKGSGPGGRIVKRDVEAALPGGAGAGVAEAPSGPAGERGEVEEASRMRLTIAKRMAEAKRDIPHFYVTAEIDMSEAMHLRESIKRRDAMPGLTVTHLLVRAVAMALVRHPRVNASWRGTGIERHADVNIGIAVAVDDGLVVPVLHRAHTLSLSEIAARAGALTERAREGKFASDDLTGGTFSISNVGMLDIEELVAVINPPQAAVLAVGAVKDRPIVRDGQLAVAKTMRATLSCDHRVLNGIEGGRFLEELKAILENPVTLLLEG